MKNNSLFAFLIFFISCSSEPVHSVDAIDNNLKLEIITDKINFTQQEVKNNHIVCDSIEFNLSAEYNFYYDSIKDFNYNQFDLNKVKTLSIFGLDTIPDDLIKYKALETLIINKGKEVKFGLFKLKNLKNLIVNGRISISNKDTGWNKIEILILNHSIISGFTNISSLKKLKKLKVLDSSIDEFPNDISDLKSLQFLQFSNVFFKNRNSKKFNMANLNLVNHPCLSTLRINDTKDIFFNIPTKLENQIFKNIFYYDKSLTKKQIEIIKKVRSIHPV